MILNSEKTQTNRRKKAGTQFPFFVFTRICLQKKQSTKL